MLGLDHNTQVVAAAAALTGASAGLAGSLLTLRKRALLGDALGHATLPGIALAYMVSLWLGGSGREPGILLAGAALGGIAGLACLTAIRRAARLSDDVAMAIVLGSFFGFGSALLTLIQSSPQGHAAGLATLVTGHAASMITEDAIVAASIAGICIAVIALMSKELRLLCFDEAFARVMGRRTAWLDALVLAIATAVVVAGLRSVGLVLIVALCIMPAAAARLLTDRFGRMLTIAAALGAASGVAGTLVSASAPDLPAGACIVLAAAALFAAAVVFAPLNGLVARVRGAHP